MELITAARTCSQSALRFRRSPQSGNEQGIKRSTSCSKENCPTAALSRSKASSRTTTGSAATTRTTPQDKGAYVLGSYLFPKPVGPGKIEILGKYAKAKFSTRHRQDRHQLQPEDD